MARIVRSWPRVIDAFPIGAVYVSKDSTHPSVLFGGGTWQALNGRVIVGFDSGDSDFDDVNNTGGSKQVTLTTDQIPAHDHGIPVSSGSGVMLAGSGAVASAGQTDSAGGGQAHDNMQPYVVRYMWERTA